MEIKRKAEMINVGRKYSWISRHFTA